MQTTWYPNASGGGSSSTDTAMLGYDAGSRVVWSQGRDGQVFNYGYDNLDRLVSVDAPGAQPDVTYGYDLLGRQLTSQTSGAGGQTLTYAYDALSRPLSETGPLGTVGYQWDLAGRNTRITWPDSYYADYGYDLTGAMTAVREAGATSGPGVLATYGYDNLGRRTTQGRGNGAATAYVWDGGSRLTSLSVDLSGSGQDASWTLGYNPAGQVVSRALSNTAYAYTGQSALDDAYANNGLNQVTAVDGASVSYDANQNITGVGAPGQYAYDAYSRLLAAGSETFAYDPEGRLFARSATGGRYLYAGHQMIGWYDGSGAVVERYVPGAGLDDYAAYVVASGARGWPAADPLGSVAALTDGTGAAIQINRYDEYGVPQAFNGPFGYTGAMALPEAGAAPWHMRNRQYHPGLGRFLQTDPIGYADGLNLYAYVGGDPVNRVDPSGLNWVAPVDVWGDRLGGLRFNDFNPLQPWMQVSLVLEGGGEFGSQAQSQERVGPQPPSHDDNDPDYNRDLNRCRALTDRSARRRCYGSAELRKERRDRGVPEEALPPLILWITPPLSTPNSQCMRLRHPILIIGCMIITN